MTRQFVATTALDEFWDKDAEEILFLGTWCLRYDSRQVWEPLRHKVLPSVWDDRARFYEAAAYMDSLGEKLLPCIARQLNEIHDERHSDRYWRILVGPWLLHALHAVYDRYVHLTEAGRLGEFSTIGLDPSDFIVPFATHDHHIAIKSDLYNLQLFTQILDLQGKDIPRRRATRDSGAARFPKESAARAKLRGLVNKLQRRGERILASFARIALYEIYASRGAQVRLALQSGFALLPRQPSVLDIRHGAIFDARRNRLADLPAASEFERVFARLVPYLMPTVYVEGYRELVSRASVPAVDGVASVGGWYFDEGVKCRAAVLADQGKKVFALQHGGGYGTYRYAPAELHERRISDSFLVWGWAENDPRLRNAPGSRFSKVASRQITRRESSSSRSILFVPTGHPRYLYRFQSAPVGSQWDEYFGWQFRFFTALDDELRHECLYCALPYDFGHSVEERLLSRFPKLTIDSTLPAPKRFPRSRLVVVDHCGTTLLESLAANAPTVLYWHPERWELRSEAQQVFTKLRQQGILFDSPETAAAHVSAVYTEPWKWWESESVQSVRREFVARYALNSRAWMKSWIRAMLPQLGEGGPRASEAGHVAL